MSGERPVIDLFYFGCSNTEPGHYSWGWDQTTARLHKHVERELAELLPLDAAYCPGVHWVRGHLEIPSTEQQVEGEVCLTARAGWTVIAWWDRSVDKRGGANMVFGVRGRHTVIEVHRAAKVVFPAILGRCTYSLTYAGHLLEPMLPGTEAARLLLPPLKLTVTPGSLETFDYCCRGCGGVGQLLVTIMEGGWDSIAAQCPHCGAFNQMCRAYLERLLPKSAPP